MMKIQEKPPELDSNPCSACGSSPIAPPPDEKTSSPTGAKQDFDRSSLFLLESENSGLRRLVVELIEKNQQLREQLQAATGRIATDLRLVSGRTA